MEVFEVIISVLFIFIVFNLFFVATFASIIGDPKPKCTKCKTTEEGGK